MGRDAEEAVGALNTKDPKQLGTSTLGSEGPPRGLLAHLGCPDLCAAVGPTGVRSKGGV